MAGRAKTPEPLTEPPTRVRGYYATPRGRFRSVTTIIDNGFPKPALIGWSGKVAAQAAVDHLPWLSTLRGQAARADAVAWLKDEQRRIKDASADHGSAVHRYLEARILGAPTEAPATDDLAAAYAAIEDFLDVMTPAWEATELVVANPGQGYAGTLDGIVAFPRHKITIPGLTVLDAKSGNNTWGEVGMQLGAYRRARVGWLRDGTEVEPPETVSGHVLHIRPQKHAATGGWALQPADTSDAVHDVFLHVKAVADAYSRIDKKVLGAPLDCSPDLVDLELADSA